MEHQGLNNMQKLNAGFSYKTKLQALKNSTEQCLIYYLELESTEQPLARRMVKNVVVKA